MRQVPTSPTAYINDSIVTAIIQGFRNLHGFDPTMSIATVVDTARSSRHVAGGIAHLATEAYARAVPRSRTRIDGLMVVKVVEAMEDEFISTMTFAAAAEIIGMTGLIIRVASRASDFYHEDRVSASRIVSG